MNKSYLLIFYILITLGSAFFAIAIGIGPPRITIDFEPNLEEDITYFVVNTEQAPLDIEMYVKGELKEYVAIDETSFRLDPGKSKTIKAHLSLPVKIDTPGSNALRIGALASPVTRGGGTVAAKAGVESQLNINVPYEGKYLAASMSAEDVKVGETAKFTINVKNSGLEDIEKISAIVTVSDSSNNQAGRINSEEYPLPAGESLDIVVEWNTGDAKPGAYKAVADINYDGEKKQVEANFNIGDVLIEIIDLKANQFKAGDIAKFSLEVQSKWNKLIKNVYAEIEIYDLNDNLVGTASSKEHDINAWEKKILDVFWDSKGAEIGQYKLKAVLHYQGKTSEKEFQIEIKKGVNLWMIILIMAVILLIAYMVRSKWIKKSKEKK